MSEVEPDEDERSPWDERFEAERAADLGAEIEELALKLRAARDAVGELADQAHFVQRVLRRKSSQLMAVGRTNLDTLFGLRPTTRQLAELLKGIRASDAAVRRVTLQYARPGRR